MDGGMGVPHVWAQSGWTARLFCIRNGSDYILREAVRAAELKQGSVLSESRSLYVGRKGDQIQHSLVNKALMQYTLEV